MDAIAIHCPAVYATMESAIASYLPSPGNDGGS